MVKNEHPRGFPVSYPTTYTMTYTMTYILRAFVRIALASVKKSVTLSLLTKEIAMYDTQYDNFLDAIQGRRLASESRYIERLERREAAADRMVGELISGKLYVYPVGGKYREGTRSELIAFLIRNNYA